MPRRPDELNLLNNVQFKLEIHNLPNVTYFIQNAVLPSISLEGGILPSPSRDIPVAGHKMEFDPLNVSFLIDQDLRNYEEIYYWMIRITQERLMANWTTDMSLHFLTGQMNISRTIKFVGAHPMNIAEVAVSSDDSDSTHVLGNVTFAYQYFTFSDGNFPFVVQ